MFSVTLTPGHDGPYTVVELRGELDIAGAAAGSAMLASAAAVNPRVIADLTALTFIDCGGLAMLCRVRNWLRAAGGDLALAAPSGRIRRVLTAAGLDGVFPVYGSAGEVPFPLRFISPDDPAAVTGALASLIGARCQEMAARVVPSPGPPAAGSPAGPVPGGYQVPGQRGGQLLTGKPRPAQHGAPTRDK